jgi:hypothetical protein
VRWHRWLPRVELAAGLEGDGSVVFLEFIALVDHAAPPFPPSSQIPDPQTS